MSLVYTRGGEKGKLPEKRTTKRQVWEIGGGRKDSQEFRGVEKDQKIAKNNDVDMARTGSGEKRAKSTRILPWGVATSYWGTQWDMTGKTLYKRTF